MSLNAGCGVHVACCAGGDAWGHAEPGGAQGQGGSCGGGAHQSTGASRHSEYQTVAGLACGLWRLNNTLRHSACPCACRRSCMRSLEAQQHIKVQCVPVCVCVSPVLHAVFGGSTAR
eukprot:1153074-Pelagomonas_calceolata.AAC.1